MSAGGQDPSGGQIARRRIARVALAVLGVATALTGAACLAWGAQDRGDLAAAVLLGHLLGQAVTATWVVGALVTFRGSHGAVLFATVGAFPLRLLLLVLGVGLAHLRGLHMGGVVFALLATQVLGHGIEAWVFRALADATPTAGGPGADGSTPPG